MKTLSFSIGEAAQRSGFLAATLRYYDELGLAQPAERAANGYRRYAETDLERLRFIGRAKHLGCSLEEISSLLVAYDGGECGPIQEQLRALVDAKIGESQQQMIELAKLLAELQRAAADLERHRPKGACDEQCGCVSQPATDASSLVESSVANPNTVTGLTIGRAPSVAAGRTPSVAASNSTGSTAPITPTAQAKPTVLFSDRQAGSRAPLSSLSGQLRSASLSRTVVAANRRASRIDTPASIQPAQIACSLEPSALPERLAEFQSPTSRTDRSRDHRGQRPLWPCNDRFTDSSDGPRTCMTGLA